MGSRLYPGRLDGAVAPAAAIAALTGAPLPPTELRDPRADFEADYLRQQAGQKIN